MFNRWGVGGCSLVAFASFHGVITPTKLITRDQWLNSPTSSNPPEKVTAGSPERTGIDLSTRCPPPSHPGQVMGLRHWVVEAGEGGGLSGSLTKGRPVQRAFPVPTDLPSFVFVQQSAPPYAPDPRPSPRLRGHPSFFCPVLQVLHAALLLSSPLLGPPSSDDTLLFLLNVSLFPFGSQPLRVLLG